MKQEAPYGWVVVWATFVCLALIFGVSYSFAAFFTSFADEFAAQRADVSWIFGLSGLVYFVLGTLGGILADRFGPRVVCSAGMVLIALGLLATSWAPALWMVYLSYGLLVGLGIAFVYTPSIASVQPWFTVRRGLAGGIASAGVGAGTLVVPLLVAMGIAQMPWREAMRLLALAVLVVGLLASALLRRAPAAGRAGGGGKATGLSLGETLRTPTFRWFYLATVLASPVMFIPFAHLSASARDLGLDEALAVGLVGLIGVGSLVGRFSIGLLADRQHAGVGLDDLEIVYVARSNPPRAVSSTAMSICGSASTMRADTGPVMSPCTVRWPSMASLNFLATWKRSTTGLALGNRSRQAL